MTLSDVQKQILESRSFCANIQDMPNQYENLRTAVNNLAALLYAHDPELYADMSQEGEINPV